MYTIQTVFSLISSSSAFVVCLYVYLQNDTVKKIRLHYSSYFSHVCCCCCRFFFNLFLFYVFCYFKSLPLPLHPAPRLSFFLYFALRLPCCFYYSFYIFLKMSFTIYRVVGSTWDDNSLYAFPLWVFFFCIEITRLSWIHKQRRNNNEYATLYENLSISIPECICLHDINVCVSVFARLFVYLCLSVTFGCILIGLCRSNNNQCRRTHACTHKHAHADAYWPL